MKNRRNYYRILHVQPDAPEAVIHASFRAIMQRLRMHPDLGGDHAEAALLNEAAETLLDPVRRAAYDAARAQDMEQLREGPRKSEHAHHAAGSGAPPPAQPAAAQTAATRPAAARPAAARPAAASAWRAACSFCEASIPSSEPDLRDSVCVSCGSALFLVRAHQAGHETDRAIERLPRDLPMTFRLSTSRARVWCGTTEDLSLYGMRFLSDAPVPHGERVQIECDFCSAVATVKFVRQVDTSGKPSWQCGVEFLTLRFKHSRGGLLSALA